jgi:hypothetical protein
VCNATTHCNSLQQTSQLVRDSASARQVTAAKEVGRGRRKGILLKNKINNKKAEKRSCSLPSGKKKKKKKKKRKKGKTFPEKCEVLLGLTSQSPRKCVRFAVVFFFDFRRSKWHLERQKFFKKN